MTAKPIRAVLFDLDGTLLDTAPDLVGALNHLRELERLAPVSVTDYAQFVSRGALGLIREGLPDAGPLQEAEWKARFLAYYADHLFEDTQLYPGVAGVLNRLEASSIVWGVVTNKPEFLTLPIVRKLGWEQRAAFVVCGDTLAVSKPDPAPVLLACELAGVRPDEAIMIGDDPRDLDAGEAAGALAALAAYGYGAAEVLGSGRPLAHVLERVDDLLPLLAISSASGS